MEENCKEHEVLLHIGLKGILKNWQKKQLLILCRTLPCLYFHLFHLDSESALPPSFTGRTTQLSHLAEMTNHVRNMSTAFPSCVCL